MRNKDSYKDNSCLLQDDDFIASQLQPMQESNKYWEKKLEEGIVDPEDYDFSRCFIHSVQVRPEFISESEILDLWVNIEVNNKKNIQKKKKYFHILSVLLGSAAIFVFLFWITMIISNKKDKNYQSFFSAETVNKTITDVQLHLANNKTVPLTGENVKIAYNKENIAVNNSKIVLKDESPSDQKQTLHELVVPWGKRSMLTLSEGSKIWINAGTRVAYPVVFDNNKREIYVDGEVFLEVSPDKDRPFIVKTKKIDVEVLGTKFNVMAYEKDTIQNIVLVSGIVKIHNNNQKKVITLMPNEMYSFGNGLSKIQTVDVEGYISWKSGIYQYNSVSLGEIMKRLSHYYGCSIDCSSQVSQMKFSGKLDLKDTIEMILEGIAQIAPITYRYDNGVYVITNK